VTTAPGLDPTGLRRLHDRLCDHVEGDDVPGLVALVARGGDVHTEVLGSAAQHGGWGYGMAAPGPVSGEPPIP